MFARANLGFALCLLAATGCGHLRLRGHEASCACPVDAPLPAGIYPTVVSPYTCTGVDETSLQRQIDYQLTHGVHGLVVLGTIGEGHVLNDGERATVIATAVKTANGRVPVVVGIHTCDVGVAIAQMRAARDLGATAVLVKYYGNPRTSEREVLAFYVALSNANVLPILLYHFPTDTGVRLSPATIRAILCLANVIGIKESTLNLHQVAAHLQCCQDMGKLFFSGTALDLSQFMCMGGHGAICPEAVILPGLTVDCYESARDGRWADARVIQKDLYTVLPLYRQQCTASTALTRPLLMSAFDHQTPLPFAMDASSVRLKEALNYLDVPTPTYARPGEEQLTNRDARQIRRAIEAVLPLAR